MFCTLALAQARAQEPRAPERPRVYCAFEDTPLHQALATIGKLAGRTVEASAELRDLPVTFRAKNLPWPEALAAIAVTVGGKVVEQDGAIRIVSRREIVTRHFTPVHTVITGELLDTLKNELTLTEGRLDFIAERNVVIVRDELQAVDRIAAIISARDVSLGEIELRLREIRGQLAAQRRGRQAADAERLRNLLAATEEIAAKLRAMQKQD